MPLPTVLPGEVLQGVIHSAHAALIDGVLGAATTPSPSPTPITPPPELITPGFAGFAATAFLVVAVILLALDMNRRVRRTRYRAEIDAELDAEQQAAAAVEASDVDDQSVDADDSAGDPRAPRDSASGDRD